MSRVIWAKGVYLHCTPQDSFRDHSILPLFTLYFLSFPTRTHTSIHTHKHHSFIFSDFPPKGGIQSRWVDLTWLSKTCSTRRDLAILLSLHQHPDSVQHQDQVQHRTPRSGAAPNTEIRCSTEHRDSVQHPTPNTQHPTLRPGVELALLGVERR